VSVYRKGKPRAPGRHDDEILYRGANNLGGVRRVFECLMLVIAFGVVLANSKLCFTALGSG